MRMPTFNKLEETVLCKFCGKERVPVGKSARPCSTCKKKRAKERMNKNTGGISAREPAAVIKTAGGQEVFVDKFGQEVENPGYDLKNDPRGWRYTGKRKDTTTIL